MTFTPSRLLISDISRANPAVVTCETNHNLTTGQVVRLIVPKTYGMVEVDKQAFLITVLSATTFSLQYRQAPPAEDVNSTQFAAFIPFTTQTQEAQVLPIGAGSTPHYATDWEFRNQYCESQYDDAISNVQQFVGGSFTVLPLAVQYGGTGVGSLTAHGFLIGNGTDPVISTPSPLSGQLPIGSTGNTPVVTTLTAGPGISISNMAGSITISDGVSMSWTDVTAPNQVLMVGNGYINNFAPGVAYILPATASLGDKIEIVGKLGPWVINQGAGQSIQIGKLTSTVGVLGSISSTNVGDSIRLYCTVAGASTTWRASGVIGNITIV